MPCTLQVGMKMEWKVSVFPEEKWKQRINMKTETEICKTEMEMDFFMRKRKQKRNGVFRWNRRGNGTFRFREYGISISIIGPWLLCSPTTKQHKMTQ